MKEFNAFNNGKDAIISDLLNLKEVVAKIKELGLDVSEDTNKLDRAMEDIKGEILRIAFVGAFSDGKTSVIAGWLGKELKNMKIDSDESTDSLAYYHPTDLEERYEIVDTPGLYGDKTKERTGPDHSIKYSDVTKNYVSEAHLVFYVLDAMNPMKDSHKETVRWLLRDLNKLNSTVFVINKMDAVANLKDPEDFSRQAKIKSENLLSKLKDFVDLTETEQARVNIVCVSANPGRKGLETFWFQKPEDYEQRSRLGVLKERVHGVLSATVSEVLMKKTGRDIVRDFVVRKLDIAELELKQSDLQEKEVISEIERSRHDIDIAKGDMSSSRKTILNELNNLETTLISTIRNLNRAEIKGFMEDELGYLDSGEFGYKLKAKIDLSFGGVLKNAGITTKRLTEKIVLQLGATSEYLDAIPTWLLKGGGKAASALGQAPIGDLKSMIFKSRDILSTITSTPIKFHPWGVTNMAKTISSNAGNAAGVLSVLYDGYELYKQAKDEEETENIKKEITGRIREIFRPLYEILSEEDKFLNIFSPQIMECEIIVNQQQLALDGIRKRRNQLEVIRKRLIEHKSGNV